MSRKTGFIESLEAKPSHIEIEKKEPLLKQNIRILEYALLPSELEILKKAFTRKSPMSTGEYYKEKVVEVFEKEVGIPKHKRLLNPEPRQIEAEMRSKKIKFPSYKKVQSTLEKLSSYGFLLPRKVKGEKANVYWYINPQFLLKYGEKFTKAFL